MEKLEKLQASLNDALITIEEAIMGIEEYERDGGSERIEEMLQDSLIQRFEYTFDTFWKYLKEFLLQSSGVEVKQPSPRKVFRAAKDADLMTDDELEVVFKMIDARNETTHTYDRIVAVNRAKKIPDFFELMYSVFERTRK